MSALHRAVGSIMRCEVCGGDRFIATEYQTDDGPAPALECVHCRALNLHLGAARSKEERDSVRIAIAARARICKSG